MKRSTCRGAVLAFAAALMAAGPAQAAAPVPPAPLADPLADPEQALAAAEAALAQDGEEAPDASAALTALGVAYEDLDAAARRRARGLLARPTDGPADQYGDGYPAGAPVASARSAHFCVFWVNAPGFADAPDLTDAAPANGVPDYAEAILGMAERSYSVEVAPGPLGWRPPKPDTQGCGADPGLRADIYLKQLGNLGLFGYESPDPGQGRARSQHGYLVLDDDYATAEYGLPQPLDAARVTFAHEFNHLLQVGYAAQQEVWLFESTATWAEEKVYPDINDYLNYVASFARRPGAPITEPPTDRSLKAYGTAIWNHWLDGGAGGLGVSAIPAVWDRSERTTPQDFAIEAYNRVIRAAGRGSFASQFSEFAGATAEWQTGDGGFPDAALLPPMRRRGELARGEKTRFRLDHTAMRLLDVRPPREGSLKLRVRAKRGVRTGIALVGRDGDELTGDVTRKSRYLRKGGRASLTLEDAREMERITAVVANADGRASGFAGSARKYTRDNALFRVRVGG